MKVGNLVRIIATGDYGLVIDPYGENQPINGYICQILTSNPGYFYVYWDELEVVQ